MPLPAACSVALKEWTSVAAALAAGRQSILLRAGGIAEPEGTFAAQADAFWIWPTRYHQEEQATREPQWVSDPSETKRDEVELSLLAQLELVRKLHDLDSLRALEPLHIWTGPTIQTRFHYRSPGLWLLLLRVWRTPHPHHVLPTAHESGCRSWVDLASILPITDAEPVLSTEEFQAVVRDLHGLLGSAESRIHG
jgi:hypothetical protein